MEKVNIKCCLCATDRNNERELSWHIKVCHDEIAKSHENDKLMTEVIEDLLTGSITEDEVK